MNLFNMQKVFNIEAIFKKYKNRIYGLALSVSRNEPDAEDILQNTFLKITQNLKNLRDKSRLSTWIYRIAYNEALMVLRKRHRQFRLSNFLENDAHKNISDFFVNWSKLPDEQLLDAEIKERVERAIRHMPIKYRMALLLSEIERFSLKDSAHILNLKINSLKTRLHRGRLLVKREMSDYFKDRLSEEEKQNKKCNIMMKFIYNYALGSLQKKKETAFNQHISDCPNCKLFLDNYLKAIRITKALECRDLPAELQAKIETFLRFKHHNIKGGRK